MLSKDWPYVALTEQRKALRLIFSEVHVDLAGRLLLTSPLHTPFACLHDLDPVYHARNRPP